MRRATAILTVSGAGLACLIGGGSALATAMPLPTEPATTVEGQAEATSALLVLADFPTGWAEEIEEQPTDQELAYQAQVAECAGGSGNLFDLGGPRAQTHDFIGPDDQRVEQSVTIVDPAIAEDFIARFSAPGVDTCIRDAARAFVAESFESPADPSESRPGAVQIGDVTIGDVLLPPAGDELVAYRVTVPLTVSGVDVDVFVDVVVVRSGGSLSGFTFQSVFEPFPADEVEHYIAVAVERLPR
jgi:hypothetical protein